MTNAELFKQTFGRYATDVWSLPENEFLEWLNADVQLKMGKWTRELIRNEKGGCIGAKMICSECGQDNGYDKRMKYCPNCGQPKIKDG